MLHATRKRGPRKHVSGYVIVLSGTTRVHACKNEVIIELYRILAGVFVANSSLCVLFCGVNDGVTLHSGCW